MNDLFAVIGYAALTVLVFEAARGLGRKFPHPALNPTLIAIITLIGLLATFHIPYASYMHGGTPIASLLGPATVALGIPLARNIGPILRDSLPILVALLAGTAAATVTGPLILWALGGNQALQHAMMPKAATTPIAMAVAQEIGGLPALAAVFAIAGGVIVAICAKPLLGWMRITDHRAFGLATGVAGSGIGAAEAVARHPEAGAYAALGIGLSAIATALAVPVLVALHLG